MGRHKIVNVSNKDWLYEQYVIFRKSMNNIAIEANCALSTVAKWLKIYDIPTRSISEANKGKKHTEEFKQHLSELRKGSGNPMYGKHLSQKTKLLLSDIRKHIPRNEEWCKNISKSLSGNPKNIGTLGKKGPLSATWKGGKSFEPYCNMFNESFKEWIRNKFNRKCYICGRSENINNKKLCVHHIDYNKKNCNPDNLTTLCRSCHIKTNFNRENWIEYFKNKFICLKK